MTDETRGWKVQVDPGLTRNGKFIRFLKLLGPDVMKLRNARELIAIGLLVKMWSATMQYRPSGSLQGWDAACLASESGWDLKVETLIDALLKSGEGEPDGRGFIIEMQSGEYEVNDWKKWQNDPEGHRLKWRTEQQASRDRKKQGLPPTTDKEKEAPPMASAKDEAIRQLLKQMSICKIIGQDSWKRELLEAWFARGIKGLDIQQLIMANPGKELAELKRLMSANMKIADQAKEVDRRMGVQ